MSKPKFQLTKWESAADMLADANRLACAFADGDLDAEQLRDVRDSMKVAAKIHGDAVRAQAVHVAAKVANVAVGDLPPVFSRALPRGLKSAA